jgi:Transglycosylase SLT domain
LGAAGITARATLAIAVLAAIAADAGHARPVPAPAGRAVAPASGGVSPAAAASPEAAAPDPWAAHPGTAGTSAAAALGPAPDRLVVPDLIASVPGGFTAGQVARIGALGGVRAVMPIDGGQVTIDGRPASVLGVSPRAFRPWTPPATAEATGLWTALASGDLIASRDAGRRLGLIPGTAARLSGAAAVLVTVAATERLGLPGLDAVVDVQRAAQLGLAANVAVLINAPGANLATLMRRVRSVIGPTGNVVNLVPVASTVSLPVKTTVPAGPPANYLALYQASAANYCPGLSWTVLAAIGQIESGHGTNNGPSSAGALGPMQFLPSTWAVWGINGFGQPGAPDIMNPLDAVPSAARMLCADGAAAGGASLARAIYAYNHAAWYVSEVLALAREYAQEYP